MCDPASITMAVVATASTVYGHQQARQQAKAQNKAADIQHKIEVDRARQEAMDRENQLSQDALEESTRINKERQELALEALREQAGIRVASAEGGVGGVSKIRSFLSADVQEDLARSDLDTSERNAQFNLAQAARGIENTRFARQQNAFMTREANSTDVPGGMDLAVGLVSANAGGIGQGIGALSKGRKKSTSSSTGSSGGGSGGGN